MSLEEPHSTDQVKVINHIQVAFEQDIQDYTSSLALDFDPNYKSFALIGASSC